MKAKYKAKIFYGDTGSVNNSLNNFLLNVETIISVTQSTDGSMSMYLTIIYIEKEPEPLTEIDYLPLDR